ncbi:MAG: PQQ-dependent dehydrogenase, methanol/ethanol family [Pseudomonadota bacterium]
MTDLPPHVSFARTRLTNRRDRMTWNACLMAWLVVTLIACSGDSPPQATQGQDTAAPRLDSPASSSSRPTARLANALASEPDGREAADTDWPHHGRTYSEQRHSPLNQIHADNIDALGLAWSFDLGVSRGIEATPIVKDGVMYVTATWNIVTALDARTGEQLWQYDPKVDRSRGAFLCCDAVNRGVALHGDQVFTGTIDGRLIALDKRTGQPNWDVLTIDLSKSYSITGAPRIVKDKVIIGNGGAEYGVRGYVSAYDLDSGDMVWRFYTVPGNPTEGFEHDVLAMAADTWTGQWWTSGGGGTVWDSMAYDAELNQLYIGVGNGSPWNQRLRSPDGGDNLFLSSIVALNPDSGEYIWHYQTTPGETWDYTATQHMILADLMIEGDARKVLMQAPKNGFFYVIDRVTGALISANNFVPVNWATHIDPQSGRPVEVPGARWPGSRPYLQTPGPIGAHNWQPMAFNPDTQLVYIPAQEVPFTYSDDPDFRYEHGTWNTGVNEMLGSLPTNKAFFRAVRTLLKGRLIAWDPVNQKAAWTHEHLGPWNGGVLSTAGNLVFQGTADAHFAAFDARTGDRLWRFFSQTGIVAAPVSYALEGEQYIAVASGWGGAFGLVMGGVSAAGGEPKVGRVMAFKLGANGELPPLPVVASERPAPPPATASRDVVATGSKAYIEYCAACHGDHGQSYGSIPNLRYSPFLAVQAAWDSVVLEGAKAPLGMAGFRRFIDDSTSEAIRAYLIAEANSDRNDAFYQRAADERAGPGTRNASDVVQPTTP